MIITAIIVVVYNLAISALKTVIIQQFSIGVYNFLHFATFVGVGIVCTCVIINGRNLARDIRGVNDKKRAEDAERQAKGADMDAIRSDKIKSVLYEIAEYIGKRESTEYFKTSLGTVQSSLPNIKNQIENIDILVEKRFGADSMSYRHFMNPVQNLLESLADKSSELVQKLNMFDAVKYSAKIRQYGADNPEIAEYVEVMKQYTDYTGQILKLIDDAAIRLDKLVLEVTKLNDDELRNVMSALLELDAVISNTKLYK